MTAVSDPDCRYFLVGYRNNLITAAFIWTLMRDAHPPAGVVYLGTSGRLGVLALRLVLRGRFAALRNVLFARWSGLRVHTPATDTQDDITALFKDLADSRFVVCGCDKILKPAQLSQGAFINYHNSILPTNRGVAAINWAKYNTDPVGFTFHRVVPEIDAGEILLQHVFCGPETTMHFSEISDRMSREAARSVPEVLAISARQRPAVQLACTGAPSYHSRTNTAALLAHPLTQESTKDVERLVRAFELLPIPANDGAQVISPTYLSRPKGPLRVLFKAFTYANVQVFAPFWKIPRHLRRTHAVRP